MEIPRLLLAEEKRQDYMDASVTIAAALKGRGYKIRMFTSSVDERLIQSIYAVTGEQCVYVNYDHSGGERPMRSLIQGWSKPGALNIFCAPLGCMNVQKDIFEVDKNIIAFAKEIETGVIPIVCADTSAMMAARKVEQIASAFEKAGVAIDAILTVSVPSPKEYQLLDAELGRRLNFPGLGYLPKEIERKKPPLKDMCANEISAGTMLAIRSAVFQLDSMHDQVDWPMFGALARANAEWRTEKSYLEPVLVREKIGILRHPALHMGGADTEFLLSSMGCTLVDVPLSDGFITPDCTGAYMPHGMGLFAMMQLMENKKLLDSMINLLARRKGMLVEGGAAPIMGETVTVTSAPDTEKTYRGLSVFPMKGSYNLGGSETSHVRASLRSGQEQILMADVAGGMPAVSFSNLGVSSTESSKAMWTVSTGGVSKRHDAWSFNRGIATSLKVGFWGYPLQVYEWIKGRQA